MCVSEECNIVTSNLSKGKKKRGKLLYHTNRIPKTPTSLLPSLGRNRRPWRNKCSR